MSKILYLDTETTGTDPKVNGLIQIAMIAEVDGCPVGELNVNLRTFPDDEIVEKALEVTGTTREDIDGYEEPTIVHARIVKFLNRYINPHERTDKFTAAGYNVRFDLQFMNAFFRKCSTPTKKSFWGSYADWYYLDPLRLLAWFRRLGLVDLPDYKLGTVCDHFGIKLGEDAHDALADIRATRDLVKKFEGFLSNIEMEEVSPA